VIDGIRECLVVPAVNGVVPRGWVISQDTDDGAGDIRPAGVVVGDDGVDLSVDCFGVLGWYFLCWCHVWGGPGDDTYVSRGFGTPRVSAVGVALHPQHPAFPL